MAQDSSAIFLQSGPVQLYENTSSSVFNEVTDKFAPHYAIKCLERGCAVARINVATGLCQLIVIHDASKAVGPPGTHVSRLVAAETGDRVWKAADFEQQLLSKALNSTITVAFNSGFGCNPILVDMGVLHTCTL